MTLNFENNNNKQGETRSDAVSRKATTEQPFPSDEQNNPENIEMEITDEMLEFFAQSMQHKKEQSMQ